MILGWLACAAAPSTNAGFVRISGDVDPAVVLDGGDEVLDLVWVTSAGGETCVEVAPLVIEPALFAYQVEVDGPPALTGDPCVPSTAGEGALGLGLLALLDPDPNGRVEVTADPSTLLDWFAGSGAPLADVLVTSGGRLAAASSVALIVADEGMVPDPALCKFAQIVPGLTLYKDRPGAICLEEWVPLSAPGERTEFQGIDLTPP